VSSAHCEPPLGDEAIHFQINKNNRHATGCKEEKITTWDTATLQFDNPHHKNYNADTVWQIELSNYWRIEWLKLLQKK